MDPSSESQYLLCPDDIDLDFEVQDSASLNAMTPKTRINYELELLRRAIGRKFANALGLNDENMWTHEELVRVDQELRERIAFIGAHPLFSEIRAAGKRDDCIQKFWGTLEKMSEGWVGTVREEDKADCKFVQMTMGRAEVV